MAAELWRRTEPMLQSDFLMRQHFPEWLGDVSGKHILDACCGEGYVARMLAARGATVKAFDHNPRMIELAQSVTEPSGIEYKVASMKDFDKIYQHEAFDVVVWSGMPPFFDEKGLYRSIEQLANLLSADGKLLVTNLHTDAYFKRAKSNWVILTSELDSKLDTQQGSLDFYTPDKRLAFSGPTYFHTPLQIKKAISAANLEIREEHAPLASQEDIKHFPRMWVDEVRIPFYYAVIGVKSQKHEN
ncbi:class I SAM-dependent methyltransferase [Candidatus Woesearchaeota archaeon]|nr:class I SAM-dependent methyltransferase [Candidatus Woesearchaeota archaeon]